MLKGKKFNAFALQYLELYDCWHMPATLLAAADIVAAICQQPCWRMPAIRFI